MSEHAKPRVWVLYGGAAAAGLTNPSRPKLSVAPSECPTLERGESEVRAVELDPILDLLGGKDGLRQFIPIECPGQGPLPGWITDIRERVDDFLHTHGRLS